MASATPAVKGHLLLPASPLRPRVVPAPAVVPLDQAASSSKVLSQVDK
jgi:hypothetical protein